MNPIDPSRTIRICCLFGRLIAILLLLGTGSPVAFGQVAIGEYGIGFENGTSPRLQYRQVRRLWIDVEPIQNGLLVTGLYPNSPARRMRSADGSITGVSLEEGDVILSIDGKATFTPEDLSRGIAASGQQCELVVRDRRSGRNQLWVAESVVANMPVPRAQMVAAAAERPAPSKLYAIVIAATEDQELGRFIGHSLTKLESQLTSNIDPERLELKVLKDSDCRADTLIEAIENLESRPSDALLVYYLGHGAYDRRFELEDPYGGHFLDLPETDLLRKTVWDHMETASARLRVLVTDSCNVESVADPDSRYRSETRVEAKSVRGSTPIEWLFLAHKGRCDVFAASKGQYAWYSEDLGGWFTSKWIESSNRLDSWAELRNQVIPETEKLYASKRSEYQSRPATTRPSSLANMLQQKKMTPQIQLTKVVRDANDPIGVNTERTFSTPQTVSVPVP